MKQSLHIKMINKPHAYPEDSGAESEAWGRLIIFHQSDKNMTILLDTEWDLDLEHFFQIGLLLMHKQCILKNYLLLLIHFHNPRKA